MVNIAGIVVYLAGDSYTWSEDTIPHLFKSGNIVAFGAMWSLIVLLYFLMDATWLVFILVNIRRKKAGLSLLVWLLAIILWSGTLKYSHYRYEGKAPDLGENPRI